MDTNTVDIYYATDGFSRKFDEVTAEHLPAEDNGKRRRNRRFAMPDAGVMTILIMFHMKQFRSLKAFYTEYITDIPFSDSTPLRVYHRGHSHKTFRVLATKGKSTVGWFYGFKLHTPTSSLWKREPACSRPSPRLPKRRKTSTTAARP
jgi:hypothetical protein